MFMGEPSPQKPGSAWKRPAQVKPIEANGRLLRPTKAYLAGKTTKYVAADKENLPPVAPKAPAPRKNGRLTVPKSPAFQPRVRKQNKRFLSMTSKELLEIAELRKRVEQDKRRTKRYHEMIQGICRPAKLAPTEEDGVEANHESKQDSSSFLQAVQSSGIMGLPAIRQKKLTTPIGFDLNIDKRALKRKSTSALPRTTEEGDRSAKRPRK
ncbi:TPA: hypothetical protein N0F65_001982 [Lagenidium giganteum]|uniref:Ribosome biogenesis protein NOP53 n=1 Tax=Lagenidium giganteum TaxID=4803 RepID=A0AAV2Z1R4_9STRA|nr:TPA: hypothetical protein N0F65_001982 [Lagenidium giganteum]